jgi:glycosyltransferase involved in cell wall biosynthesis
MNKLDIFYYRSGTHVETFGRVVLEAMASAVPVVCFYYGGYAEHIQHGVNGYLFRTNQEAMEIIQSLYADASLRKHIGTAGRLTAEKLFSPEAVNKRMEFYQKP